MTQIPSYYSTGFQDIPREAKRRRKLSTLATATTTPCPTRVFEFDNSHVHLKGKLLTTYPAGLAPRAGHNAHVVREFLQQVLGAGLLLSLDTQDGTLSVVVEEPIGGSPPEARWRNDFGLAYFGEGDKSVQPAGDAIDVVGHELGHALLAPFIPHVHLSGQPRGLVEHICDVIGVLAKQWHYHRSGEPLSGEWRLGASLFSPAHSSTPRFVRDFETGRSIMPKVDLAIFPDSEFTFDRWAESRHSPSCEAALRVVLGAGATDDAVDMAFAYALAAVMNRVFYRSCLYLEAKGSSIESRWNVLGSIWWRTVGEMDVPASDFVDRVAAHDLSIRAANESRRSRRAMQSARKQSFPTTFDIEEFFRRIIRKAAWRRVSSGGPDAAACVTQACQDCGFTGLAS
jgi:hypothetical protein